MHYYFVAKITEKDAAQLGLTAGVRVGVYPDEEKRDAAFSAAFNGLDVLSLSSLKNSTVSCGEMADDEDADMVLQQILNVPFGGDDEDIFDFDDDDDDSDTGGNATENNGDDDDGDGDGAYADDEDEESEDEGEADEEVEQKINQPAKRVLSTRRPKAMASAGGAFTVRGVTPRGAAQEGKTLDLVQFAKRLNIRRTKSKKVS